ncbi:MAG: pyridoxamine 5'-phosphate oxidase family protein [Flavisolibacter sp.]|jgi:general stress protein 26|nr:pyridoxamine 5'-phosphate oxidase family protein [Flavisolibacter sp.]
MSSNQQLIFLQEKIKEIGSAIFFNLSDSVLKIPTSVVHTIRLDDFGYVWFYMQKPRQDIAAFEKEFPVKMDYFKKGSDFFLQVNGKAYVVSDPEEINTLELAEQQTALYDMMLVKVKILKAEYYETRTGRISLFKQAISKFTTWFRNNQYRPDTYYPAS